MKTYSIVLENSVCLNKWFIKKTVVLNYITVTVQATDEFSAVGKAKTDHPGYKLYSIKEENSIE